MFSEKKAFKDLANFAKCLKEYFSLKDKVLWEGVKAAGTTFTVPNLSKYRTVTITTRYGNMVADISGGGIFGLHSDNMGGQSLENSMIVSRVKGSVSGNDITLTFCDYTAFINGQAKFYNTMDVRKVTGLEPYLPQSLQTFLGGGYCIGARRRSRHAISETMLKRYFRCCTRHEGEKKHLLYSFGDQGECTRCHIHSLLNVPAKRAVSHFRKCGRKYFRPVKPYWVVSLIRRASAICGKGRRKNHNWEVLLCLV